MRRSECRYGKDDFVAAQSKPPHLFFMHESERSGHIAPEKESPDGEGLSRRRRRQPVNWTQPRVGPLELVVKTQGGQTEEDHVFCQK